MLTLARQHIFYDMGYYYDFGNLVADMRTGAMANSPIASLWESGKPVAQAAIDELNAFKDN